MDKRLVLELPYHNVYYIKNENNICYYVTVPKKGTTTNIAIELKNRMGNYDMELNDEVWVMENVKTTFSYIDSYNITLVLPVLNEEMVSILEKVDDSKYDQIDKVLASVINGAYRLLKEANNNVDSKIIIIDNERYKTFINWFMTKYHGRSICKSLLELIQIFNANATPYKKLETPGMNFVIGSYNTEVKAPKLEPKEEKMPTVEPMPAVSSGFASYWLLVVVTIVVAAAVAIIAFAFK